VLVGVGAAVDVADVLDASALLAYFLDERGAEKVEQAMAAGAVISTVNLAEVFTRLADARPDLADLFVQLDADAGPEVQPHVQTSLGAGAPVLPDTLTVEPFTLTDAMACAALRPATRPRGLSLGDRACLALGRRIGSTVLTADRNWLELDHDAVGVTIELIRPVATEA
jgi:ribonuclease VapC